MLFILPTILATLIVLTDGNANFIQYDVRMTHLLGNNKSEVDEREIFIDESFLPTTAPTIDIDDDFNEEQPELDNFVGRLSLNLSETLNETFGKLDRFAEEYQTFDLGFGVGVSSSPHWSSWTCCRRTINVKSRERVIQKPRVDLEYSSCYSGYCTGFHDCKDNAKLCQLFVRSMGKGLCDKSKPISTFMSHHCPVTCNFCSIPAPATQSPYPTLPPVFTTTRNPWKYVTKSSRYIPVTKRPWYIRRTTQAPRTTQRPWTTKNPWRAVLTTEKPYDANMVRVNVLYHYRNPPYRTYMYTIDNPPVVRHPWKKIRDEDYSSDLNHFYLYIRPTGKFTMPLYFCRSQDHISGVYKAEKWAVSKRFCGQGWRNQMKLYASSHFTDSSELLFVANRGKPHWTTRVSKSSPSRGYTSSAFYFYAPKKQSTAFKPAPTPYPVFSTRPTYTRRPYYTTRYPRYTTARPYYTRPQYTTTTYRPIPTTKRPVYPYPYPTRRPTYPQPFTTRRPNTGDQPRNEYNKECLESHNFFRAVHNVPPLKWSSELARTAQSWADSLARIAPERPNVLVYPSERTRNWPHSEAGKGHRNLGDGENIAWDLSGDGSPAKESVMRWYSEIFYYNRKHPTHSKPNKPVGHLTQMLWKDSTHLGCGVSVTPVGSRSQSTWSISHYSPGGNMRYTNSLSATLQLYNRMVPEAGKGSCMTRQGACNNGNQCMAFGPSRGTCVCNRLPVCKSATGCIAWCENRFRFGWTEKCQGKFSCKCTEKRGAVCDEF